MRMENRDEEVKLTIQETQIGSNQRRGGLISNISSLTYQRLWKDLVLGTYLEFL
jgi:hypothetical protein